MRVKRERLAVALGLALCALTLAFSVALAHAGYLTYLNADMASETILARRQADTHSLVQMDWLYSTEIHALHMNLLYALAFLFTPSFEAARIAGNALGFILGMAALVYLLRALRVGWGAALCAAALLPVATGTLYASNMTIGGYYIVHLSFGFLLAGLWLACRERGGRGRAAAFAALCALEGFLSVRYVLCFACPMFAVAALDWLFAPGGERDGRARAAWTAALGFFACVAGYAASEIVLPRVFSSGVGGAGSFAFVPLDGPAMARTLATVAADLLKLLGWRGGAALFSAAGMVNLFAAATLFFGAAVLVRALRAARGGRRALLLLSLAAFAVNLFCFALIEGAYLNRYLILAVIFFVPALPVALSLEKSARLRAALLAALAGLTGLGAPLLLAETREAEPAAVERGADMADAAAYLLGEGYTHGYGTFWNVRVMQERTQGALTFTGVVPSDTEEGALVPCAPDFIRWLEPADASSLDVCPGKTFLLLTPEEEEELGGWLALCGAPKLYENGGFAVYGFASSRAFVTAALLGRATLEAGDVLETGAVFETGAVLGAGADGGPVVTLHAGGRLRIPPCWREAGAYVLRFDCEGAPAPDSAAVAYTGRTFAELARAPLLAGENAFAFELGADDKYFMLQLCAGGADGLSIRNVRLERAP